MHLLNKYFGIASFALLSTLSWQPLAYAQGSVHMKSILASEPIPEKKLAQDQVKLNVDYDPTAKFAVSCTIYTANYRFLSVTINVLSTYKINACDPDLFRATTAASVKAQLSAYQTIDRIVPVGPHVQLMDRNTSTVSNPSLSIGLLNFSKIATAHIGLRDLFTDTKNWSKWLGKSTTYIPIRMAENTDYVWLPGSKVYYLVSDKNEIFIMSHFYPSGVGNQVKSIENTAENLGQYLNLPSGWRYEVKTLKKILNIKRQEDIGHTTTRVFDEYSNAYIAIASSQQIE